jgi:acyl-CoA oxidase
MLARVSSNGTLLLTAEPSGWHNWAFADLENHQAFHYSTRNWISDNASLFGIHTWLFLPFAKTQLTEEQAAYWLPLAESGNITGCYAKTELGHGTFVGGIETTATFDPELDEFIIHSPTLSSTKYWPGALGYTCSHAAVMARSIIDGKDFGIHTFMVQIRSLEDFQPIPGMELGDIG